MNIKSIIKLFIPPIILNFLRLKKIKEAKNIVWEGNYLTWEIAKNKCEGYDSTIILNTCKKALLKVRNSEAIYERDSVLFEQIQYSWGLLAGLQKAALANDGNLCVLDFGGSLGSSYYQNKSFLNTVKSLEWCIVEQKHFVKCGQENFENEELKFYTNIEKCLKRHKPNVLLLSSVLQYLEQPNEWIEKFISLDISYIIIDRTGFIENSKDVLSVQKVPNQIYEASYPCWFFEKEDFIKKFKTKYNLISLFDSGFTKEGLLNDKRIYWEGLILNK